jgi:hypothetical protein
MTAEQLHLSPAREQVAAQPSGAKAAAAFSQVIRTDETERQSLVSDTFAEPLVIVLSVYVPSALAVKVPVVVSVPVTGTLAQPRLKYEPSRSPAKVKQDDEETVQVPTTEPPHGVTSVHDGPVPPVPPVPLEPPLPALQAEAKATTVARRPTRRKPKSACLIGGVLWRGAFSSRLAVRWRSPVHLSLRADSF